MNRVMDYETGAQLRGRPHRELVAESAAAEPTGAVPAFCDAHGIWQYVPPSMAAQYRTRGIQIITVWVP